MLLWTVRPHLALRVNHHVRSNDRGFDMLRDIYYPLSIDTAQCQHAVDCSQPHSTLSVNRQGEYRVVRELARQGHSRGLPIIREADDASWHGRPYLVLVVHSQKAYGLGSCVGGPSPVQS